DRPSVMTRTFFFQAEDGIRDRNVTGVQTVLFRSPSLPQGLRRQDAGFRRHGDPGGTATRLLIAVDAPRSGLRSSEHNSYYEPPRSEERRVGKEGRSRWESRR